MAKSVLKNVRSNLILSYLKSEQILEALIDLGVIRNHQNTNRLLTSTLQSNL